MKFSIVIPAHNEEQFIEHTLLSLAEQTLPPLEIVVVDDQSTDQTSRIVQKLSSRYPFISLLTTTSSTEHLPGSKVVNAFNKGLSVLNPSTDVLCKFDADLIFPEHYLERLAQWFSSDETIGMAAGVCHIKRENGWVLENLTDPDHIRGALKAYRRPCFEQIGGLRPAMGWDTVDELLAQYHGWKIITDPLLAVRHLRPTGFTYSKKAKLKQGEAFYRLRYGWFISLLASAKLAYKKKNLSLFRDYLQGYRSGRKKNLPFLVSEKEGAFIRRLRYRKMLGKLVSSVKG